MSVYVTDGSFDGLLCAIFASYQLPAPSAVVGGAYQASLLDELQFIDTDAEIAERVVQGILSVGGRDAFREFYRGFLSEAEDAGIVILRAVRKMMRAQTPAILGNFADADMLSLRHMVRNVNREVHRMHAFVRFVQAKNQQYYALISPDCDVIPLLSSHFESRFADMVWTIYDTKRGYGLQYDLQKTEFIEQIDIIDPLTGDLDRTQLADNELAFQGLWQGYFSAVSIASRRNIKHHIQQLPRRYWKYLSEKQFKLEQVPEDFSLRKRKV